jgi:hypothetical protein
MGTKQCNRCNEHKPVNDFPTSQGKIRGFCRDCYNAKRRTVYKDHIRKQEVYVPMEKPEGAVLPPYVVPLSMREVYVPPKWGR